MQRYVVILLLFLTTISSAMADTTGSLIQRVDSIMDNISQIYGKKQARIDFYKNMAEKSRKPETLLSAYDKLYDEYFVFQFDSAMVYVDKAIQLADRIGDKYHHDKSRIEKASLLAVGGLYGEALGLLGEIDSVKLDEDLRFTYTITHYYVYSIGLTIVTTILTRRAIVNVPTLTLSRLLRCSVRLTRIMISSGENTIYMWNEMTDAPYSITSRL